MNNEEAKQGGVESRKGLYAYASKHSKEAIDILYILMTTSKNEGIRLGAARSILNKCLPDPRAADDNIQIIYSPIPILGGITAS